MDCYNYIQNWPAYWIRGDGVNTNPPGAERCPEGQPSYNTNDTHPYNMSKNVTMGCFDMDSCIQFDIHVELGNKTFIIHILMEIRKLDLKMGSRFHTI